MACLDDADRLLVEEHVEFARSHAGAWARRTSRWLDREDVFAIANLALCDAATKWTPARYPEFRVFAFFRIRAAIIEELRTKVGRHDKEPAFHRRLWDAQVTSLDAMIEDKGFQRGEDDPAIVEIESQLIVDEVLAALPPRERFALTMLVYEDMPIKDIGELLGVHQSRVSQLVSQARDRLRSSEHVAGIASAV